MPDDRPNWEANRLYWETDESVADIANALDISRRALYDAIQPRPAGGACPECGVVLVFRNRTAAERGRAECPDCDVEMTLDGGVGEADVPEPTAEQQTVARSMSPLSRRPPEGAGTGAALGGSLLAGLALGAVAGYLVRKR